MLRHCLISRFSKSHRSFSLSLRTYCDQPPQRFNQDVPSFKPLSETRQKKVDIDKMKLENWRMRPAEQPYFFKSKLGVFDTDEKQPNTLALMSQPIDFRLSAVKSWLQNYQIRKERYLQQFIPERHEILGNDLAAAHFILFRKGKVKFVGQKEWIEMDPDEDTNVPLPNKYDPVFELEAIKCDGVVLYYEGLENIRRLKKLTYLSFKQIETFDDWCLDRVSGSEFEKLEVLDISETKITANGLQALYRIPSLRKLIVTYPSEENARWDLTVAMLQDILPKLEIVSSEKIA